MASLHYFGCILTFVSYLDTCIHDNLHSAYSFGKKQAPTVCDTFINFAERCFLSIYTPVHSWIGQYGVYLLSQMDGVVAKWCGKVESMVPTEVPERLKHIRDFWKAIGARIAEHWQRHGVILGTLVIIGATIQALIFLLVMFFSSGPCRSFSKFFNELKAVKMVKNYFQEKIQPFLDVLGKKLCQFMMEMQNGLLVSLTSFKESADPVIDSVVGHECYEKMFRYGVEAKTKIEATKVYKDVFSFVDPYISPIVERVVKSELYMNFVDKMTPVKEE